MSHDSSQVPPPGKDRSRGGDRGGSVSRRTVERVIASAHGSARRRVRDLLATEEPLEIVLAERGNPQQPHSVTMRTPGADFDLVAGFLFAEGVVNLPEDIAAMRYCAGPGGGNEQLYNRVEVRLTDAARTTAVTAGRSSYISSSCGVCGMASIEAVMALGCPRVDDEQRIDEAVLLSLPARLRAEQSLFQRTGGLHAAARFDALGSLLRLREDVGRHNAMDKLVGSSLLAGELPLGRGIVLLSGRLSFELVQKAARAGVSILAGVSAPSSLAVELADRTGITLVGFLREASFNVYAGGWRIGGVPAPVSPGQL